MTPELSDDPAPEVLENQLDDFGVGYVLRVFTSGPPPFDRIRSVLGYNILDEFHRIGVEILTSDVSVPG